MSPPYSRAEEDYLKAIYKLTENSQRRVSTNGIAAFLGNSAASVTDMTQRLSSKELIDYKKYKGVSLNAKGKAEALRLVRSHRLWECFLVNHLGYNWGEVHHLAEQMEHISSSDLTNRLDAYLGFPKYDPHGEPIPSEEGKFTLREQILLSEADVHTDVQVVAVKNQRSDFLNRLEELGLALGVVFTIESKHQFDHVLSINLKNEKVAISPAIAKEIYVQVK